MEVEFCLLAEKGILASQAILLCQSLRHFGGRYAAASIIVISPRKELRPSQKQVHILEQLGVKYVELDLRSPVPEYGPSFRVLALAWLAEHTQANILVQLDSDTVFLNEPDIRPDERGAAARPVDLTGMCSAGPGDPFETVWERMAGICHVDLDALPFLITTLDRRRVRASYNAGLIIGPRNLFSLVGEYLVRILRADIRPHASLVSGFSTGAGEISLEGAQFFGTSQAAISLALASLKMPLRILDPDHNVPVHLLDDFPERITRPKHLHYHWAFPQSIDRVLQHERICFSPEQKIWLRERMPIFHEERPG